MTFGPTISSTLGQTFAPLQDGAGPWVYVPPPQLAADFSTVSGLFQSRTLTTPVTGDGDPVGSFVMGGQTMAAPDDPRRLVWRANVQNGLGGIQGTAAAANFISGPVVPTKTDPEYSAYMVLRLDSWMANAATISWGDGVTDWNRPGCVSNAQAGPSSGITTRSNEPPEYIFTSSFSSTVLVLYEVHVSTTRWLVIIDGKIVNDAPPALPLSPLNMQFWYLNARWFAEQPGDNTFGEWRYYQLLNLDQQEQVRVDMRTKWGI